MGVVVVVTVLVRSTSSLGHTTSNLLSTGLGVDGGVEGEDNTALS